PALPASWACHPRMPPSTAPLNCPLGPRRASTYLAVQPTPIEGMRHVQPAQPAQPEEASLARIQPERNSRALDRQPASRPGGGPRGAERRRLLIPGARRRAGPPGDLAGGDHPAAARTLLARHDPAVPAVRAGALFHATARRLAVVAGGLHPGRRRAADRHPDPAEPALRDRLAGPDPAALPQPALSLRLPGLRGAELFAQPGALDRRLPGCNLERRHLGDRAPPRQHRRDAIDGR